MRVVLAILAVFSLVFVVFNIIIFVKKSEAKETRFVISIQEDLEKAYYEGQRDALEGDIRIKKVDSVYLWTKSCWDSGKMPIFNPSLINQKP
jgi:hypothetical protein